ncbi:MAG: ATP-binding protein [Oscillospiraceae bacterium]|jgi:Na+-driven multidrug efflux pump/anti-sigma regulatory factor (Ser/Thr protein kinase)|nr:ATP-binding protein [Oscillospiraceae bacterium]
MIDRTNTLINKKFRAFLIPTIVSTAALAVASVIDNILVGNLLGEAELAAIGLSSPFIFALNTIALLFMVGGLISASAAKGQMNERKANLLFTLSIYGGAFVLLIFGVAIYSFAEPIARLLALGKESLVPFVVNYLRMSAFSGPFVLFTLALSQYMRAEGQVRASAVIPIVANAADLVMGYVFMAHMDMGISGAGLSTTLSYVVGVLLTIPYLASKKRAFRFILPKLRELAYYLSIFEAGMSRSLGALTVMLRNIILNAIILSALGVNGMTAMTVITSVMNLVKIIISGTSDTLAPIISTLNGERDFFGVRESAKAAFKFVITACVIVSVFLIAFPQLIGAAFGVRDAQVLAVLNPAIRLYTLSFTFFGIVNIMQTFYAATGRAKLSSFIPIADDFVFISVFVFALSLINADLLWLGFLFAELLTIATVLIIGARVRRRSDAEGVLLLKPGNPDERVWDTTIPADVDSAVNLSEQVIGFCTSNGTPSELAVRVGIAVEEVAVNIAKYGGNNRSNAIDILVRLDGEKLTLRIRDDGQIFSPLEVDTPQNEPATTGIAVLRAIAGNIEYSRQLGFNTTVVTFA